MRDPNRLPGPRDIRTTLDGDDNDGVVVACPPHPQFGGDRHDGRLRAVSDALRDREWDCLRIDYGAWDEGRGERSDALTAIEWADERYETVALFGYSFGGAVALAAGIEAEGLAALSALAPAADSVAGFDPADLDDVSCPAQIVYGERDDTADWKPVVDRAEQLGWTVESMPADHFFVSQQGRVGELVGEFIAGTHS
ncbi:alpha/beta hydrolase [Halovenus sp. WSH3]|uniref:Alpha/beta hydrolase n=1 Tax=Halovenus carboxidivorans TaxID=2692199 RepID=A0A6B0T639_9EURY|nr:alpha/beta hydrolase [Halovenus carboxidivorans]MXR51656.1 alpha/beta hydrolase [Halovenus carboxidivorans]